MRQFINIIEAVYAPPTGMTLADHFIRAATQAIKTTHGETAFDLKRAGPTSVTLDDRMNGVRGHKHWALIRTLTGLAQKNGVTLRVSGSAGRSPWH